MISDIWLVVIAIVAVGLVVGALVAWISDQIERRTGTRKTRRDWGWDLWDVFDD